MTLIAIPTTAGTGSETTGVAIMDLQAMHAKTGIAHRRLKPTLGYLDPENTRTMPSQVAAANGQVTFMRRDTLRDGDKVKSIAMSRQEFLEERAVQLLAEIQHALFAEAKARLDANIKSGVTDWKGVEDYFAGGDDARSRLVARLQAVLDHHELLLGVAGLGDLLNLGHGDICNLGLVWNR